MTAKHIVLGQMVNASVVLLSQGALVIDTSVNPEGAQELVIEAAKYGEVLYVINTHEHGDHLAGNNLFSCPIISSTQAREQMLKSSLASLPTLTFSQELELHLSERVILKHFGGHCPGAAVVYFPERRLLFSGDLVFAGRMPYMGQADFRHWLDALAGLETWDVNMVVPGHGPQGGKELLTQQRQWLESYIGDVLDWSKKMAPVEIFQQVLAKHEVVERWHPMITKSIELVIDQFA